MEIERYSHVMHISSTVTGRLQKGLDCWDALRAALPAGTVSGAPKSGHTPFGARCAPFPIAPTFCPSRPAIAIDLPA
ncbi:Anthranilate synthase component I-1, chloroplastic [Monoraphidium neglectum]|uniref:Anthranilate synthase component I-1, chloroplastic n=1 Tax=Monoraphidium neglectum TaxID=145388 RepID=A0A0D2MTK0_9CHLO|nr:Anthranilate synthase component I-1, chloroplastic [Monoraphidium neglectum]KIZ05900.1 Anthranilate synthase component I-1, chloroplastic [Monoraphidium neglectum]|eukprot:XP_013904919.1 Anthranilate synthase component I-1, chloroplastic [Monoraphidium neglectum]